MNKTPLISVIATTYNNEPYIGACIESVINQTYPNWELWIMDDASTDDTMGVIARYEALDARVHGCRNDHGGMSKNRHRGMQYVEGEWVTFLDGDDVIAPQMLELMVKELNQRQDADIIAIKGKNFDADQKLNLRAEHREVKSYYFCGWEYLEKMIQDPAFFGGGCTAFWGKLYRKSLFENESIQAWLVSAEVRMPNTYYDDLAMIPRLYYEARKAILIDDVAYFHRISCGGISEIPVVKTHNFEQMKAMKDKLDFYLEIKADEMAKIESVAVFLNCLSTWYKGQLTAKGTTEYRQYEDDLREMYKSYYYLVKQNHVSGISSQIKKTIIAFWKVSPILWKHIVGSLYFKRKYHYR